jgi:hypothetical protein
LETGPDNGDGLVTPIGNYISGDDIADRRLCKIRWHTELLNVGLTG